MDIRNILGKLDQLTEGTMAAAKKKDTGPKFTGKMKGTDPASAAKDKYVGEGSILRDLEAELNKDPEKRDLVKEFREFKEGATGAKPGWMLKQDPALAKKLKDQQARKKHVLGKPTPNKEQSVEEARAASAAFRSGNARRGELNAMSPEERAEYDRKRAEQQRKRDDARLERERQKNVTEGDVVAFPKKHKGDLASVNDCPKCGGDLQGGKYMGHEVKVCMPCKQVYLPPNSGIDQQGNPIKEQDNSKEAWAAGYQAFHNDVTKCPYAPGSAESGQWNLGWESAQARGWNKEGVAEGADERKQNALWAQITAHEKAAAKSKDLKRQHHINMADQLRSQLKTSDNEQGVAEDVDAQWIPDVVRLLGKLVLSSKAQAKYNVEPQDIPDIKEFINLLSAGNLDAARDHWSMMEWNDLDNALEYFVRRNGLPHIRLHDLLGEQGVAEGANPVKDYQLAAAKNYAKAAKVAKQKGDNVAYVRAMLDYHANMMTHHFLNSRDDEGEKHEAAMDRYEALLNQLDPQGLAEGWKEKVAGAAIGAAALGGIGALQNVAPNTTYQGHQFQLAMPGNIPPDAKLVTDDNGKKIYVWKTTGQKNRISWSYRPAEELKEFAPDGFNGGDDGEEFNPKLAKMAYDAGVVKGVSLTDNATLKQAIAINDWDKHDGGIYAQHFAKGFKAGRMNKINHDNKQYNLNLQLMKDGSISRGEQGVAEGFDREEFRRHMEQLRAREELRKRDPVAAKALDLRGQLPQQSKKRPEDDSIGINDPRHPGYAYTQAGHQGVAEAAKGILHRVRYSYNDPSGNSTASGHITLHAPDKVSAARYATSDLTKRGKKNVRVHAVTPQKVAEEFTDLDLAVMEGGHELVKEAPVVATTPTLGADLSKPVGQQSAQDKQAQQLAAQKQKQQQATLQKGVNDLKAAGAAVSNPAQVVKAFDKAQTNQGLTPGDKSSIASAGTVLAPIMANPQLQGKFKDLVTQASAAQKKEQQQAGQTQQPNAVGLVK